MTATTTLLPFQPTTMTPAQLAAVSFLARYGWGGCPKGTTQCSWCNAVLAPGERLAPASTEPLPAENTHRVWQERYSTRVLPPAETCAESDPHATNGRVSTVQSADGDSA